MPLQATSGAASYDAFGGGVAAVPNYIEDVFSTYLYTGNGSTQTINNGIDLAGKGGLVWLKARNSTLYSNNMLADTAQGANYWISSNRTDASDSNGDVSSFNSNGFGLRYSAGSGNPSGIPCVSWTFRKQPKFFDVVTYTGDGTSGRVIPHSLGSTPGCVIWKRTSSTSDWFVQHRSVAPTGTSALKLNTTAAAAALDLISESGGSYVWDSTSLTLNGDAFNTSGQTFVLYIFAHDAGGFGLTGTDNVISCGSYVKDGSGNATVTLGYEPQWIIAKPTSTTGRWYMYDNMRDMSMTAGALLSANYSNAESSYLVFNPTATGFKDVMGSDAGETYIYIAIRRGPMKVPTSGTSVFAPVARSGTGSSTALTSPNIVTDMAWIKQRDGYDNPIDATRLIGPTTILFQNSTSAEVTDAQSVTSFASNVGYTVGTGSRVNASGSTYANWVFKRAPSVFDVVCYTGNGVNSRMVTHNLGVQPELLIIKRRDTSGDWSVAGKIVGGFKIDAFLNTTAAFASGSPLDLSAEITSTAFQPQVVGNYARALNTSGGTYVAYLFATCAGVSKVGSYTGTGTLTTINCGFTSGARFVMIKRTDSTGSWYIWDTARGMVAGTDPSLMINDSEIEVNANSVYTASTGFQLLASPSVDINTSGGTYIYLAMA